MRYVTYERNGESRLGLVVGEEVIDIVSAVPGTPKTMLELIQMDDARRRKISETAGSAPRMPIAECRLRAPIPNPGKFVCLGLNYAEHAKEGGHALPDYPSLFLRASTSLIGPDDPMIVPSCSKHLDYEAELAIVIGKRCRHVREEDAHKVIFGFTVFNDGSIRDYQRRTQQWTAGKNFDGTGSLGPWIVTADEVPPNAKGLGIRTRLNNQLMQNSNTDHMIFSVYRTIAILSEFMSLEAGDVIASGTPNGVGHARTPPVWMKPGDTVEVEVDGIGVLRNPIAAEVEEAPQEVA
jgi:2-keto-4-pentenoate hydratase/2-oxohepta-3-ene-1,7-dioic acid hydratase in catechol pathway